MLNKKTFGHRKASRRSAFSLIELSIVLIIIGLLISGIIGGASLIKSATLRSVMTEARGYNIASSAFYTKFNALPGDYNVVVSGPLATTGAGEVGNANGYIEYASSHATAANQETLVAIKQLYQDGSLDASMFGTYTYAGTAITTLAVAGTVPALVVKSHIPGGKIKASGWVFDSYTGSDGTVINMAMLTGGVSVGAAYVASTAQNIGSDFTNYRILPILTPQDALSIDTKMDDGVANTGTVRPVAAKNAAGSTANTHTCGATAGVAATAYGTASTVNCALGFRIDTTS